MENTALNPIIGSFSQFSLGQAVAAVVATPPLMLAAGVAFGVLAYTLSQDCKSKIVKPIIWLVAVGIIATQANPVTAVGTAVAILISAIAHRSFETISKKLPSYQRSLVQAKRLGYNEKVHTKNPENFIRAFASNNQLMHTFCVPKGQKVYSGDFFENYDCNSGEGAIRVIDKLKEFQKNFDPNNIPAEISTNEINGVTAYIRLLKSIPLVSNDLNNEKRTFTSPEQLKNDDGSRLLAIFSLCHELSIEPTIIDK